MVERAIRSVAACADDDIVHWIVIDGPEAARRFDALRLDTVTTTVLPANVGRAGWNGHRVYGALPWLVSTPYCLFLDEDNALHPTLVRAWLNFVVTHQLRWSFCFRTIYDAHTGAYVCDDDKESLGTCVRPDGFSDTGCYLVHREAAMRCGAAWAHPFRIGAHEADRKLFETLRRAYPYDYAAFPYACLRYYAGSTPRSVSSSFFLTPSPPPRHRRVFLFHFHADATDAVFAHVSGERRASPFDEWSLCIYDAWFDDETSSTARPENGFRADFVPSGSACVFALCHPETLPDALTRRRDIHKVLYAFESPNYRHRAQWSAEYLARFDVILTYWTPLRKWPCALTCPQVCHPITAADVLVPAAFHDVSVGIVLENRDGDATYEACGVRLRRLDGLRARYAYGLARRGVRVVAYGPTWTARDGLEVGDCGPYVRARGHPHRLLHGHTFALVLENCDAEGYVSEKLFDALCAGCIPLYYGGRADPEVVDVPRDAYVDLRTAEFSLSDRRDADADIDDAVALDALARFVRTADVDALRARVFRHRDALFAQIGTARFASILRRALRHTCAEHVVIEDPTAAVDPHTLPRGLMVFVGTRTAEARVRLGASVRRVRTSLPTETWEKPDTYYDDWFRAYNTLFDASRTPQNLQPRLAPGSQYSVPWSVFRAAVVFARAVTPPTDAESVVTASCLAVRFALSLCELPVVALC